MIKSNFISMTNEEKEKRLRQIILSKTNNMIPDKTLDGIIKFVGLDTQYKIIIDYTHDIEMYWLFTVTEDDTIIIYMPYCEK